MYVLLAFSITACAIVLAKLYQFLRCGLRRVAFVDEVMADLTRGDQEAALQRLAREHNPVARVMEAAIRCGTDRRMTVRDIEAEVSRVGTAHIRSLESWLRALSAIAHLSPLLGLLGTVTGMINAFMRLQEAGSRVDPAVLSGGIWEALLTTAFGLTIAIPAMAAFYLLEGEIDRLRAAMKDAAIRVLIHLGKSPESISTRDELRLEDEPHGI